MRTPKKLGLALLITALVVSATFSCGPDSADPKSPAQVLLDHAIGALWGDVSPDYVVSLRTRSTLTETQDDFSSTFELETLLASENRYREIRSWRDYDLSEVSVISPKISWRLVDGTVVDLKESEEEEPMPSLQSWLFAISKLAVLKDTERFKLKHKGSHETTDKRTVERLEIHDKERPNIALTMDFDKSTWLLERVTLTDETASTNQTIILRDYRAIEGIQFAHEIDSLKNGQPYAQQRNISYELNPKWKADEFVAPVDLNRDAVITKKSISGVFAFAGLKEEDTDIAGKVDALRSWIMDQKLEISGPLIVVRPLTKSNTTPAKEPTARIAIAIKAATPEFRKTIKADSEFGILDLESHQALCLTQVGERKFPAIRDHIANSAKNAKLMTNASALEIYFSREGTIRQVQIPIQ